MVVKGVFIEPCGVIMCHADLAVVNEVQNESSSENKVVSGSLPVTRVVKLTIHSSLGIRYILYSLINVACVLLLLVTLRVACLLLYVG